MPETTDVAKRVNRLPAIVGASIFVFAFLFRLVGVGWGLKNDLHNQSYHPDELVNFGYSQQLDVAHGQFLPHFYGYGTLYFTLLSVTSDAVKVYGGAPDKSEDSQWEYVARCELWGRIMGITFGAGTAVLLFAMMRRFTTLLGAALAGIVIAIAPAHVVHSRFLTVDILAAFFIAASAWAALRLIPPAAEEDETPLGWKYVCLAGLFAGLSAGVKYTGILALFTLYAAVILAKRKRWVLESIVATVVAVVAFVVSTPGCLFDQETFFKDVTDEMHHVATGHGLTFLDTPSGFIYHLSNLFMGLGTVLTLVCLGGLIWAAVKKQHWCWALLAFALPYYILIGREEVKFLRYTFPLYVALAAGFGWAIAEMHRRGGWGRLGVAAGIVGLGGLDFGGLRAATTLTAQMAGEDPRDSALRYIRSVASPTTRVGVAREIWYWSVPLMPNNDLPASVPMATRIQLMNTTSKPPVDLVLSPSGDPVTFSPKLITDLHPDLIVFTSIEAGNLVRLQGSKDLNPGDQSLVNRMAEFKTALEKNYTQVKVFGTGGLPVEDMEYINPQVFIWKRTATP